jgi:pimeloyl-ACP methyl ester carboxylesterase/DNA-binding CsgD family transcriptional regulator
MPNPVPLRRIAKDVSTPMDDADFALVIEAMYQVAADPDRWEQLIEALGEAPARDEAPASAVRGLANSEQIARLVSRADEGQPQAASGPTMGWVVLSSRRKVAAANDAAHAIMATGLGELKTGAEPRFRDPSNDEALTHALRQARAPGAVQTILKLERDGEDGPCFAYVIPARALPGAADAGAIELADDDQSYALVFPAVEETGRLWTSIRDSFGLTPAEIRLASRLRDGRTLKEAADELSVSINTVRNQLRAIFDKMGLKRQSELIRALAELSQVAGAIEAHQPGPRPVFADAPAVRHVQLPDGRRLAYRDYGDPAGRPMLYFHEGIGSSLLPHGAQALALELGLRIVSVERPGFGQSDPHPDYSFDAVAEDVVELCDQLGLDDVRLSAVLSGAPSAIQTAIRLGDRASRILICSGRPPRPMAKPGNLMTQFRARLEGNPWVVETFYAILRLRLSPALVSRMIGTGSGLSPSDRTYLQANPWVVEFVAAYVSESLAVTSRGASDEVKTFRRAGNLTVAELTCPLTVWHGEEDQFAPLSDLLDYLGDRPREVRVFPGVGHMLALRHWDDMLREAAA